MSEGENNPQAFSYVASSLEGQAVIGTIDAADIEQAGQKLRALLLQVTEIKPVPRPRPAQLRGDDFLAFNQQLAQLTASGLPVEEGLRLIALDMESGSLAQTIHQVANDLEKGKSLPQAVEASRSKFPPLYDRLLEAGIRSGNLSGTLLNLGVHLTLVRQLRTALWRTITYPIVVLLAAFGMLVFISFVLIPPLQVIFHDFKSSLPVLTQIVFAVAALLRSPITWTTIGVLLVAGLIIWALLRSSGADRRVADRLALSIPLIAPIIRRSLIARWCDAMRLAVEAGMDLPAAITLAGDIIDSPLLREDCIVLISRLSAGGDLNQVPRGRILPLTVVRSIQLATERNDLPQALRMLSQMYQQQAQGRLDALPGLLTPLLLILVAFVIGFIVLSILAPLLGLVQAVSGPVLH